MERSSWNKTLFLACMYGVVDRESLSTTNTNKITSELAPERTDAHSMLFTKGVGLSFFSFFLFFGSFSFGFTLFNIFQL